MSKNTLFGKQNLVGWGIIGFLCLTAHVAGWFPVILLVIAFVVLALWLSYHHAKRENAYWGSVFQRHREEREQKEKSLQKRKAVAPSARRSFEHSSPAQGTWGRN
jgi:uncharacterized membrane protein YbaN (DUF454 family)